MSLYPISRAQVAELYVATFDRAPMIEGLVYWSDHSGLTIEQIAESFFDQPETQDLYPDTLSNTVFVNTIFNNTFDRDAEPAGLAYWVQELESGSISRANMILAIINGAQNTPSGQDQRILDNKTEVGLYFAQNGKTLTLDQAYEVMAEVTSLGSSVERAMDMIDNWGGGTSTIFLTTMIDVIEGYDNDMMIEGLVDTANPENTTLNTGDIIDGGGGDDVLKILMQGETDSTGVLYQDVYIPNMSNVETMVVDTCGGGCRLSDLTFDLTGTTGLNTIIINSNIQTPTTPPITNLTVTSSSHSDVTKIDGSNYGIGKLTILGGIISSSGAEIIGGSGDDTIDLSDAPKSSSNEITGGKGGDDITASSGKDIFNYAYWGDTGTIESELDEVTIIYTYSAMETADTISDFATGSDQISFEGLAPGNADNFAKGAAATSSFIAALEKAYEDVGELHIIIDPISGDITDTFVTSTGIVYSYQYDGGKTGYLFMDSDADGFVDQWIVLAGLDANDFNSGDIA